MKISPVNNVYKNSFCAKNSRKNNVAILGSSKMSDVILPEIIKASEITKNIILNDKNIVTGCGSKGIMGQAFYTAVQLSKKDENGKSVQNLAIIKEPLWGDEDVNNCIVITTAKTEAERIDNFIETADSFVVFPGGPGTIQEASTLISNNYYDKENGRNIVLVGKKYFEGLDMQYQKMYESGLLKCKPSELYTITDDIDDVMEKINK